MPFLLLTSDNLKKFSLAWILYIIKVKKGGYLVWYFLVDCKNTKAPVVVLNVLEIMEEKTKHKKI